MHTATLTLTAQNDREIVMTRVFNAPRTLTFEAMTKPDLVKRWLLGPPGWTMPICVIDLKVGGTYRYVWRNANGTEMGVSGVFREVVSPERLVHTETFDQSWYPGEAVITTLFSEQGDTTTITITILYETPEARDMVLKSPMEKGVAASYDRLAELLASFPALEAPQGTA